MQETVSKNSTERLPLHEGLLQNVLSSFLLSPAVWNGARVTIACPRSVVRQLPGANIVLLPKVLAEWSHGMYRCYTLILFPRVDTEYPREQRNPRTGANLKLE